MTFLCSQWVVRPIVEAHGWDHESGIEGFSLDKAFLVKKTIPANISGQVRHGCSSQLREYPPLTRVRASHLR